MAPGFALYIAAACLCLDCVLCLPVEQTGTVQEHGGRTNGTVLTTLGNSVFDSFEDVATFLQKWFKLITNQIAENEARETGNDVNHEIRARREVKMAVKPIAPRYRQKTPAKQIETAVPELTFEDLEKQYLINKTMNFLEQIYFYEDYVRRTIEENQASTTTTTNQQHPNVTPVSGRTTEDPNRGLSHLLSQKLQELSDMPVSRLQEMLQKVQHAAQRGVGTTDISRLCCSFG